MINPYENKNEDEWFDITCNLIKNHPLDMDIMVDTVLETWEDIFNSSFGKNDIKIGVDIFPTPQIMGFLLHELIPINLKAKLSSDDWVKDKEVSEKDLVYRPNLDYSVEIKTSSDKKRIFGNRSYAQKSDNPKKSKTGYFLAVNFEKFNESTNPKIRKISFGWLNHEDWRGQKAQTGQQANLPAIIYETKLLEVYPNNTIK
ncbi:ScaI family restriction endonuclease [Methanobrevibacter smithii]|uniref:ScaI family restriction endonuclease n=1 Tax=Methanobrevibacter smithii TaxID=2173 RepID=UPI00035F6C5D|nr:ScaI family restriction endonuclease [Methanobrevibacter smithii]